MEILLKEDVETLGYAGEVHKVAPGYARNYLIPRGYAVKATSGVMKAATAWRNRAEARRAQLRAEYDALVAQLNGVSVEFTAKAGEQGKLYGSITTASIADAVEAKLGIELDRRKIEGGALRQVGEHKVPIVLSGKHRAEVTVHIHAEGSDEEEAEEAVETVEPTGETAEAVETAEPTDEETEVSVA